jgi:hypothetical protein
MAIVISDKVRRKLTEKHNVSEDEIRQCFVNGGDHFFRDNREDHQTNPPSHWFISETNQRRKLKIVFLARRVEAPEGQKVQIEIKTAYPPNAEEIALYDRLSRRCDSSTSQEAN